MSTPTRDPRDAGTPDLPAGNRGIDGRPPARLTPADRFFQWLLIVSLVLLSWLGMMALHELGHVLHLWWTGGTVRYVFLHPLALSYTQPGANPHPGIVAAGGGLWGCALPLAFFLALRRLAPRQAHLAAFFAGFCLVANGAYLLADAFTRAGDARQLLAHGAPRWTLVLYGLFVLDAGLDLWNGLGPEFGRGARPAPTPRLTAIALAVALVLVVLLELLLVPSRPSPTESFLDGKPWNRLACPQALRPCRPERFIPGTGEPAAGRRAAPEDPG